MTHPPPPDNASGGGTDRLFETARRLAAGEAATVTLTGGDDAGRVEVRSLLAKNGGDGGGVLLLRSADELTDYLPHLAPAAADLARRWWPGPVTLELAPPPGAAGLLAAAPAAVAAADEPLRVRCPADPALADLLRLCPAPLLADGAADGNDAPVVRVADGGDWELVAGDPAAAEELRARLSRRVLFVCTGNTCRSPLAEALLRRLSDAGDDGGAGFLVTSAGLAAGYGAPASPESVELAAAAGADLSDHQSQPLTEDLLEGADHVFCMTNGHRRSILSVRPDLADRVTLLDADGGDIPDPIGGGMEEYEACREAIERGLAAWLADRPNGGRGDAPGDVDGSSAVS